MGLAAAGVLVVFLWAGREDQKYAGYLNSGANANKFLKSYGAELKATVERTTAGGDAAPNVDGLLAYFADDYKSPGRGHWKLGEATEINGVLHSYLEKHGDAEYGREELGAELAEYVAGLQSVGRIACKINLLEEMNPGDSARINIKFVVDGVDRAGRVLQDRFFFRWWLRFIPDAAPDEKQWEIVKEVLIEGPEDSNTRVASDAPGFELLDLKAAGVDYVHHRDPKLNPEEYPLKFAVMQHAGGGVASADYDGDGLTDILFLDGVRSRLYRHEGIAADGSISFRDVTAEAGLDGIDRAHAGLFADFDNDGDQDLFVSRYESTCRYLENQGDGTFVDRSTDMNLDEIVEPNVAATLLDYDRDGWLDVYLAVNGDSAKEVPRIPFFARNGQANILLRNVNGEKFEDVTATAGVGDTGWSLAVCAGDLDGDGWPEIGVANDFGRKSIYHNNGDGTFREIAKEAGTLDFSGGMGIVFGDLNMDGLVDIYTSNIYSNQRWLGESAALDQYVRNTLRSQWLFRDFGEFVDLYSLTGGDWRALGKMAGEGNSLFLNQGAEAPFREARESSTNRAGWGWSVALLDTDNDSDLDIYAANGWITGQIPDDL